MTAPDLKTLTDDELQEQWGVASNAMNAIHSELMMLLRVRAAYNVANYPKLHRAVAAAYSSGTLPPISRV